MKTTHPLCCLTLALGLAGCFPAVERVPDEAPPIEVPPEEVAPTLGEPQDPALVPGVARNLAADCPSTVPGLAAELAELSPGDRLGVGAPELRGRPDAPFLQDDFAVPVALIARDRPMAVDCVEAALAGGVVAAATGEGAAASEMIRHAADILGDPAWRSAEVERVGFEAAWAAICARFASGEGAEGARCGPARGRLPADLERALTPVMWAIHDGVAVRMERDGALEARDASWWRDHGGRGLLPGRDSEGFNAGFEEDRAFLEQSRGKLYGAAAAIAAAIEAVDWSRFRDRTDVRFDVETPAGWVRVRGGEVDRYSPSEQDTLLLVDLGGDDVHLDQVASNTSGANAVSVVIDLGGSDSYGYEEAAGANLVGARLPLDADGTVDVSGKVAGASASGAGRQGSARNGIAMLFDLGGGADRYVSLRASQGYAHQGVGVLLDDGGADVYFAEDAAQGAGQFGIGLLIDLGDDPDARRSSHASQGFGYVAGVGVLYDAGGADTYDCHPDHGGSPAYVAPQMPGEANASMCQGAGLGFRIKDAVYSMAGGVGLLVDRAGDDTYRAGVYAQGVGYWQGLGMLSDQAGSDVYDAYYYAQGAAAHFGAGILADSGDGSDQFGVGLEARTFVMGAAQDFSTGVFVNEGGDDVYQMPSMGGGAASCGSTTLFVDNGGMDRYVGVSDAVAGVSNASGCGDNTDFVSTAVFLDVEGLDDWRVPGAQHGNDRTWGIVRGDAPGNRAFARDVAGGDSGIHVGLR